MPENYKFFQNTTCEYFFMNMECYDLRGYQLKNNKRWRDEIDVWARKYPIKYDNKMNTQIATIEIFNNSLGVFHSNDGIRKVLGGSPCSKTITAANRFSLMLNLSFGKKIVYFC